MPPLTAFFIKILHHLSLHDLLLFVPTKRLLAYLALVLTHSC